MAKASVKKKPEAERVQLNRLRDDQYWDEAVVDAGGVTMTARVVPRFKTSALSGNEWRVSARTRIVTSASPYPLFEREYGSIAWALGLGAATDIYAQAHQVLGLRAATLSAFRGGYLLMTQKFSTFGEAAICAQAHIIRANEGWPGVTWHHLDDPQERSVCCQPGCKERPTVLYRMKHQRADRDGKLVPFEYDWQPRHRWFCGEHAHRGNQGLDDSDSNYEVVEGKRHNFSSVPRDRISEARTEVIEAGPDFGQDVADILRRGRKR